MKNCYDCQFQKIKKNGHASCVHPGKGKLHVTVLCKSKRPYQWFNMGQIMHTIFVNCTGYKESDNQNNLESKI